MQDSKSPMNKEKLSQLMDGEWHELNPSDCVAGACSDEALRAKWERYHLIRDVMKNEPLCQDNDLASRICAAVADEESYSNITPFNASGADANSGYDQEQVHSQASSSQITSGAIAANANRSSTINTGLMGLALAASVAAVTVVTTNVWQSPTNSLVAPGGLAAGSNAMSVANSNSQAASSVVNNSESFAQQFDGAQLPEVEFVSNTGSYWVSPQTAERVIHDERLNMMMSQHFENSPTAGGLLPYSRLVGYEQRGEERQ